MTNLRAGILLGVLFSAGVLAQPLRQPAPENASPPLIYRNLAGQDEPLETVDDVASRLRAELREIANSTASAASKRQKMRRMVDDNILVLRQAGQQRAEFDPETLEQAVQQLETLFFEIALEAAPDEQSKQGVVEDSPVPLDYVTRRPILIAPDEYRGSIVVTLDSEQPEPWWRGARVDTEELALNEVEESPETPPRKAPEEETVAVEFLTQDEVVTVEMHDDTTVLREVEGNDGDLVLFDALHIWVGGAVQLDAHDFDGTFNLPEQGDSKNDTSMRRGEVIVRSTLYDFGEFKWQYDVESNIWRDLYWRYVDTDNSRTITVGNQKEPMGLDFLMGNKFGTALERSAPASAFGSFRGTGIRLNNWFDRSPEKQVIRFGRPNVTNYVTTSLGLFTEDFEDTNFTDYALTGRVTVGQQYENGSGRHIGVSASLREGDFKRIAPRPEVQEAGRVRLASPEADTQAVLGIESMYTRGPFHAQAELYYSDYRGGEVDAYGYGGYVQAGWFLTGEERLYRPKWGLWAPLPHSSKSVFELFARFSHTYGNDDENSSNYLNNITVGGSWYLARYRASLNLIHSKTDNDLNGEDDGFAVTARFQYLF